MGARVGMWLAAIAALICLVLLVSGIMVSASNLIVVMGLGVVVFAALAFWLARTARQP